MWCETFGYDRREQRFGDFWAEEELRVQKAIAEWPLSPSRLPELQRPEAPELLLQRLLKPQQAQQELQELMRSEGPASKSPREAMKVTNTLKSKDIEYFYIDTQQRLIDFPDKAVVMEIWRQQTLDAQLSIL